MNNENMNNELNTMGPSVAPTITPVNPANPVTPVVADPSMVVEPTPVSAPEVPVAAPPVMVAEPTPVSVPEAPVVAPPVMAAEPAPVSAPEAPVVAPPAMVVEPTPLNVPEAPVAPQPTIMPETVPNPAIVQPELNPQQPMGVNPQQPMDVNPPASGEETPKKKPSIIVIVAAVVVVVAIIGAIVYFVFGKESDNEVKKPEPTPVSSEATQFFALASEYVDAVNTLWTNDELVCQDAANPTDVKKPSELSSVDSYGGPAFYYVFIDTKNSTEVNLNVDNSKGVAGWIRVGIANGSYYVALSDGVNYLVDKGTDFDVPFSSMGTKDVVTGGNGSMYQYLNGEIFGSNTNGNGWGIGDVAILKDGDDSNDGIYMSNGKKTDGYTPYCAKANN